jgi:hypothetical protein
MGDGAGDAVIVAVGVGNGLGDAVGRNEADVDGAADAVGVAVGRCAGVPGEEFELHPAWANAKAAKRKLASLGSLRMKERLSV